MRNKIVWVVLPTYNERENIEKVISKILVLDYSNLHVLVVDDGSPDGTSQVVVEMQKTSSNIHLLTRVQDKGRGAAGIAGYKQAISNGAEYIVEMDADLSHNPKEIPKLLEGLNNYDLVLGSRYISGGADLRPGNRRHLLSALANAWVRAWLGLKFRDCNTGYRCFRRETLKRIIDDLKSDGPEIVQEVLYQAKKNGLKIVESPIIFIDRKDGKSKLTAKKILKVFLYTIKLKIS